MATFATLPGDLLTAIASYVDTPHFVVAVAADGDAHECFYGTPSPSAFFPSISCPSKTGGLTETARVTGVRQVG